MAKTKFSIEGAFEQLEDIIEQLSSEEISLSDSMEGQNDAIHKGTAFEED